MISVSLPRWFRRGGDSSDDSGDDSGDDKGNSSDDGIPVPHSHTFSFYYLDNILSQFVYLNFIELYT